MTWEDMTEPVIGLTVPGVLPGGLCCIGVTPKVKKIGFISINVWVAGFYVGEEQARATLDEFKGKALAALDKEALYMKVIEGSFRRGWVCTLNRGLTASQLSGGFREGLSAAVTAEGRDDLDRMIEAITDIKAGQTIEQIVEADGTFSFTFAGTQHQFGKELGRAVLVSGIGPSVEADMRLKMVARVPDLWPDLAATDTNSKSSADAGITKAAVLKKYQPHAHGIIRSTWQPRKVWLKGHLLYYSHEGEERKAKEIDIRDCVITDGGEKLGRAHRKDSTGLHFLFCVTMRSNGSTLKFSSQSSQEVDEWLYLLQECQENTAPSAADAPATSPHRESTAVPAKVNEGLRRRRLPSTDEKEGKPVPGSVASKVDTLARSLARVPPQATMICLVISNLFLVVLLLRTASC